MAHQELQPIVMSSDIVIVTDSKKFQCLFRCSYANCNPEITDHCCQDTKKRFKPTAANLFHLLGRLTAHAYTSSAGLTGFNFVEAPLASMNLRPIRWKGSNLLPHVVISAGHSIWKHSCIHRSHLFLICISVLWLQSPSN